MKKTMNQRGAVLLVSVLMVMLFLLILIPLLVKQNQQESKWSVRSQKAGRAFVMAQSAVDQGYWKLKTSTASYVSVMAGAPIPGYNFDQTFTDPESNGHYRIRISSTGNPRELAILAEGWAPKSGQGTGGAWDVRTGETRTIRAVYQNNAIPGPLLSRGNITLQNNFYVHWGAIASKGDITLMDNANAGRAYPRKYARLTVKTLNGGVTPVRDTNGLSIPNDHGGVRPNDWFSNSKVVNLPQLDFDTLRAQAAAAGTLNCYGKFAGYHADQRAGGTQVPFRTSADLPSPAGGKIMTWSGTLMGVTDGYRVWGDTRSRWRKGTDGLAYNAVVWPDGGTPAAVAGSAGWNAGPSGFPYAQMPCQADYGCALTDTACASLPTGANRVVEGFFFDPRSQTPQVWYWDGRPQNAADTVSVFDAGDRGTFIIKGDAIVGGDDLDRLDNALTDSQGALPARCLRVPSEAWREYADFDSGATNEYPGDAGQSVCSPTFNIGTTPTLLIPRTLGASAGTGAAAGAVQRDSFDLGTDIGIAGLFYVGGDLRIDWAPEFYGSLWVDGNINLNTTDLAAVFYDASLAVPMLDVMLEPRSWAEVANSTTTWVAP